MSLTSTAVLLLAVAMVVALLARRLRVPYTVALVAVGLALGGFRAMPAPHLTKELLYSVFLPGLLFEAAFHLDAKEVWRNKRSIFTLAVPGVVLAIALTAPLLVVVPAALGVPGFAWRAALVFAALIAATDPIAVVALFRAVGAPRRLALIVDGESLVNDGTAVVLYTIALGVASGTTTSVLGATADFARVVGLGVLVGAGLGYMISEVFALGEQLHASGVLATVTAGVLCGSYGAPKGMCAATRLTVESFWQYIAFALNSVIFLLIGLGVRTERVFGSWRLIVLAYLIVMLTRAALVYLVVLLLRRTRERVPWSWGAVLTWGGLRGALSMVLALALADSFVDRDVVVQVTFGVVTLTILVNGMTVAPLLKALGMADPAPKLAEA
jgi:CPA1 family monovalent cation:H+ antiporter